MQFIYVVEMMDARYVESSRAFLELDEAEQFLDAYTSVSGNSGGIVEMPFGPIEGESPMWVVEMFLDPWSRDYSRIVRVEQKWLTLELCADMFLARKNAVVLCGQNREEAIAEAETLWAANAE